VWIVGGAVRDLALRREPKDVDLTSALPPADVEAVFGAGAVHAVGRAFGTLVVPIDGVPLQHTTFRSEEGYSDARRPDAVRWGTSLEEDASRRDFRCNALYLDPRNDELADPEGGLADLEARRLACVGDPAGRFAEDGLRILRMARFVAAYDLRVDPATAEGARASLDALRGVSRERIWAEIEAAAARPEPVRFFETLESVGALERLLGELGWPALAETQARRAALARLGRLAGAPSVSDPALLLAGLFDPELGPGRVPPSERAAELQSRLRLPRAIASRTEEVWRTRERVAAAIAEGTLGSAAARVRLVRGEAFPHAAALLAADDLSEEARASLEDLVRFAATRGPAELFPEPLLASADLAEAGVPRGPRWGELLQEAERLQLDGALTSRAEALAWLAEAGKAGDAS